MSMKWESIKKDSDFNIEASIITREDGQIRSIGLLDDNGDPVRIVLDSYSLKILIPAKPKTVKKFGVTGTVIGLRVNEYFDTSYEAEDRVREIGRATANIDGATDLVVSEVELPELE